MSRVFRYGLYGVGRIGRVHGQIVKDQGHVIAAIGDDNGDAVEEAVRVLDYDLQMIDWQTDPPVRDVKRQVEKHK